MHIITVVVDNKRAVSAYRAGLAQLDAIWPKLMDMAQEEERRIKEKEEKEAAHTQYILDQEKALHDKEFGEYQEKMKQYQKELDDRMALGFMRRFAPFPKPPTLPYRRPYVPPLLWPSLGHQGKRTKNDYEIIRRCLVDMVNLSELATEPFAMSEHECREMIRWEDGTKVRELLENKMLFTIH